MVRSSQSTVPATVDVRRSNRRRRTVSAHLEGETVVVQIPASFSKAQEQQWVDTMVARLQAKAARRRPSDADLDRRAQELSTTYLGGRAEPSSVRWVDNQNSRWGSCSIHERSIRLSSRLRGMPAWVIDYVLLHELAHLIEANHNDRFWALLTAYPKTERARGFLEGHAHATQGDGTDDVD